MEIDMVSKRVTKINSGDFLMAQPVKENIIRIRVNSTGEFFESTMEKYGIVKTDWNNYNCELYEDDKVIKIKTEILEMKINKEDGSIGIKGLEGKTLLESMKPFTYSEKIGVGASFNLSNDEKFYGLGYRQTDFIELRGNLLRNHVSYGECYGPQPFIMSSNGWGVFYNTTRDSYFDIGFNDKNKMNVWSEKGELDFYIMVGDYKNLINSYTLITGRPALLPQKAYGLMFICNEKENQFDVLNDARDFRREGIPCDYLGLEPGWMEKHYDLSTSKDWDKEKFYMPWWSEDRKQFQNMTFIGALKRSGFNLSLWLCCDYDIFNEEEKEAIKNKSVNKPFGFGKLDFDPRAHSPIYMDKVTDKDKPWFEHLKKFVDSGVAAFKQDPAFVVNDHPDRLYANGMIDDEAHNIYTTILAKQVHEGYKEYTGQRPMHFMGTSYTGIQKWAPTWTCDCGGRERAFIGMLQNGICGHMNVSCDMDVHTIEGIHFGFLLPWSLVNSWASIDQPWWLGDELYEAFKFYSKLHYALIPYIYSFAQVGASTGMPIIRALPLMYPDDDNASNINSQYMFGDSLMVSGFTNNIYLPEGNWIDYFTGENIEGSKTIEYNPPKGRGGALFIKRGAIIPNWHYVDYVNQKKVEDIIIHFYPDGESEFTLYEDDGVSFEYINGALATTFIKCVKNNSTIEIKLEPRKGEYIGKSEKRSYSIVIHEEKPKEIYVNNYKVKDNSWWSQKDNTINLSISEDISLINSNTIRLQY